MFVLNFLPGPSWCRIIGVSQRVGGDQRVDFATTYESESGLINVSSYEYNERYSCITRWVIGLYLANLLRDYEPNSRADWRSTFSYGRQAVCGAAEQITPRKRVYVYTLVAVRPDGRRKTRPPLSGP